MAHSSQFSTMAFARRAGGVAQLRGERKILSPQDAALIIQKGFRACLIRRSQALPSLRKLALAKNKLKDIRALFNNLSYPQLIAFHLEERQRFFEMIIALLLMVDAIQGVDVMIRGAKGSILDELEAILDVLDPQPRGKMSSMKRRIMRSEIEAGCGRGCPNA